MKVKRRIWRPSIAQREAWRRNAETRLRCAACGCYVNKNNECTNERCPGVALMPTVR
jgi:hypothetical protein